MKKVILIGSFLPFAGFVFAQSGSKELRNAYMHYGTEYYDKAKTAIDKCIEYEDTKADAKTWLYRGNIYLMIEVKKNTKDSIYYKRACDNCAEIAYDAYMQALKIDPNVEVSNMNISNPRTGLRHLADLLVRDAYKAMGKSDYEQMYQLAKKARTADSKNLSAMYCLGLAAEVLKKMDEAKLHFRELVQSGVRDTNYMFPYIRLANIYLTEGDYPNAVKTIETGLPFFLHDTCFKIDYAVAYSIVMMGAGRSEDAEEIMTKALKKDPTNLTLLINYGSQLNSAKFYDEAEVYFKRAIELSPNDMISNYNMGNCYYNKFVDKYNALQKIDNTEEYNKAKEESKTILLQAKPYLEKARELDGNDLNTLIMLRRLYMEISDTEKYKDVEERMQELRK